jgi:carboxymethylenebutenolidase
MIIRSDETLDVAVSGAGSMRTHLARPAVAGRFPGVLLFSEIYQVTDPIRRLAAMVAGRDTLSQFPKSIMSTSWPARRYATTNRARTVGMR